MSKLPTAQARVVAHAREADDPTDAHVEQMLSSLHARLEFDPASTGIAAAAEPAGVLSTGAQPLARALLGVSKLGAIAALAAGMLGLTALFWPHGSRPPRVDRAQTVPHARASTPAHTAARSLSDGASWAAPHPIAGGSARQAISGEVSVGRPTHTQAADSAPTIAPRRYARSRRAGPITTPARTVAAVTPASIGDSPREPVPPASSAPPTRAAEPTQTAAVPSELDLIARALRGLRDHRPAPALSSLNEHAARYPDGQLASERRGLRVLALCELGERARARQEAERFLDAEPDSPLATRVARACPEEASQ